MGKLDLVWRPKKRLGERLFPVGNEASAELPSHNGIVRSSKAPKARSATSAAPPRQEGSPDLRAATVLIPIRGSDRAHRIALARESHRREARSSLRRQAAEQQTPLDARASAGPKHRDRTLKRWRGRRSHSRHQAPLGQGTEDGERRGRSRESSIRRSSTPPRKRWRRRPHSGAWRSTDRACPRRRIAP